MTGHIGTRYGGYYELPGTDDFAYVDMRRPQWFEPHPKLTGLRLAIFRIARRLCQRQSIWFSPSWFSNYYRKHGVPPLKPHQTYMHYDKIFYTGEAPVLLPPLNE